MPLVIDVTTNADQVAGFLRKFQRRQLPFALSRALNDTAFDVRKEWVDRTFPRAFNLRNKRFPAVAIRVKKSTKRALRASVFDRLGLDYLVLHQKGGTKRPRGRHIAVPTENVRRTASGRIGKAQRPRQLLSRRNAFIGQTAGGPGIFQRNRQGPRLMFGLETSVRIKPRLKTDEAAARVVRRRFRRHFRRRFAQALRTARR